MKTLDSLTRAIQETSNFFLNKFQKQINVSITLRNWLIESYIVEYAQRGEDRAAYGLMVPETLSSRLKQQGLKGMGETNLKLISAALPTLPSNSSDTFPICGNLR